MTKETAMLAEPEDMKDYYVRQAYHKRLAAAIVEVFERNGVKCQHAKAALEYANDVVGERMANAVIRPSEIKEVEGFYSGENPYALGLVAGTKENIEMLAREKREKEEARLKESQQSDPG